MITKEAMVNGLINYIDGEIIPSLPQSGKWIAGTAVVLMMNKTDGLITTLIDNPIMTSLGVVSEDGLIDNDRLLSALLKSASKYGKMNLNIPIVGTLRFSADDVDTLGRYMMGTT